MASRHQVKQYLAYWFQLGKRVLTHNGSQAHLPRPVIQGDRYSQEFEDCWHLILSPESQDCYLEGTSQTITNLLQPQWEIDPCVRCGMPVPLRVAGLPPDACPCFDLPAWPNPEMPQPRSPVSNQTHLNHLRERLSQWNPAYESLNSNRGREDAGNDQPQAS